MFSHEISYGEQILNDIIIKTDTIIAYITQEGDPAIEKYVVFNRLYDTQGTLTPSSVLSDSMGIAQSIYGLVYSEYNNQITSDTVRNIIIDIGAQINIWRVLVVTGLRGQEVSNKIPKEIEIEE